MSTNFHIELQGLSVSLRHEGREPAVSGSTVVPDSSLPMNDPYFDVGAGLEDVLDVVSVSHLGCPHHSSLPVIFPDVNLQYHDDWDTPEKV